MAINKKKKKASIARDLEKLEQKFKEDKEFAELLLDTVREGLLVLDKDHRVELANESFYHLFKVDPEETEGKLLYNLGNGQWDIHELHRLLEEIIPKNKVVNDYEIEHKFETIGRKVMLLNARRIDHLQIILVAIEDVTKRNNALRDLEELNYTLEEKVKERTLEVRKLVSSLAESEQEERRRISHILHDDLQQMLIVIRINVNLIHREVDSDTKKKLSQSFIQAVKLIDAAIEKTRQLTSDLSPFVLKSEQLTVLLTWLANRFNEMHGLKTELNIKDDILITDENNRVMLLQFMREMLFNIVKHAGTDRAIIRVDKSADDHLVIEVIDEGSGFEIDKAGSRIVSTKGFGLFNIRERVILLGGKFEIDSVPGKGTRMIIQVPL